MYMKKNKLALAVAFAVGLGMLVPAQAQAAVSGGYELSASLANGSRGVTVLADTDKAEVGVNSVIALTTSDTLAATEGDNVSLEISGSATFTDYTAAGSNPTGVTLTSLGKLFTFTATTSTAVNLPTNIKLVVNGAGTITVTQKKKVSGVTSTVDIKTIYATTVAKTDVYSSTDSFGRVQADGTAGTLASNVDVAGAALVANAGTGYVNVLAKDGYAATMSTSGVLQAAATNGAIVAWDSTPVTQVSFAAKTGVGGVLYVKQGTANTDKPVSTTVTVTFNGAALTTKTVNFTGDAASIVVSGEKIAQAGGARTAMFDFVVKDAAGNQLAGVTPVVDSATLTSQITAGSIAGASSATAVQTGGFTCAATSGASAVRLKYTLADLSVVYSNTFDARCGQGANKYTAKLDKDSYLPGEIATLTVSAVDVAGAKVYDGVTLGTGVAISVGGMTAVTTPASTDAFASGAKTYKYTVGNNTGAFNAVVDLPAYVSTDSAKVISYKIAKAEGSATMEDVLKSIVALIATINKQIAQLQKLILARK